MMKHVLMVMVASTLIVGAAGCRVTKPSNTVMMPAVTYGSPALPSASYVDSGAMVPTVSSNSCGPGCTSCSNTLPIFSGAQSYASAPAN
jgi:hypothetical protein